MAEPKTHELTVASSQRFVSCPSCRAATSVADVMPLNGAIVKCSHCGDLLFLKVGDAKR